MKYRTASAGFSGSIHPVLLLLMLSCVNYYSAVTTAFWPSRFFSVSYTNNSTAPLGLHALLSVLYCRLPVVQRGAH